MQNKPACKTNEEKHAGDRVMGSLYFKVLGDPSSYGLIMPCTQTYYETKYVYERLNI